MPDTEPALSQPPRSIISLTLREVLLLVVIIGLALAFVRWSDTPPPATSRSLYSSTQPIEYRYWHQRGPSGSGSGSLGSGNEWLSAKKIDVFETFVLVHQDNGLIRRIETDSLVYFDWRPAIQVTLPPPPGGAGGH